ncbi:hypothetical protein GOP47_0027850 [Adiantum capillus-veneris]|nr:hypothetical protein GOP47_0027850 [Adiantum capillus-veneris]
MRLLELQPISNIRRRKYTETRLYEIIRFLCSPEPWTDRETTYIRLLESCSTLKALAQGKQVHSHMVKHGLKPNAHTWSLLVSMYANCGCFSEAHHVLKSMVCRTSDAWTALIAAYIYERQHDQALQMFYTMLQERVRANEVSIVCALSACMDLVALKDGLQIHAYIVTHGHERSLTVQNEVLKMYCKCHALQLAERVFTGMEERNEESWTALIVGYVDHKLDNKAISIFQQMVEARIRPNKTAFANILQSCANLGILDLGRDVHQHIRASGLGSDALLSTMLITMYSKCGSIQGARRVFSAILRKDITSWNAMLGACMHHALYKYALKFFDKLKQQVIKPDRVTISIMVDVCINLRDSVRSKEVYSYFRKNKVRANIALFNSMLDMFIKCVALKEARQFFDGLRCRDVDIFNTMIAGYAQAQCRQQATILFRLMQEQGIKPNKSTFTILQNICDSIVLEEVDSQARDNE